LLPSLFTVANLFFGFWAVIDAIHDRLDRAPWLILLAGVLDGLDGKIARLTHSTSDFGKEYDSLADVISFGMAPAIVVYQWGLRPMGRWGWAVAFLFLVAGSVRLARFNVHAAESDRRFFTGLAIPGGAGSLTLLVLLHPEPPTDPLFGWLVCAFVFAISVLMVSTVPYRSFKELNWRQRWPAWAFFVIALIVALIAASPVPVMAALAAVYLLSGPVEAAVRLVRRRWNPQTGVVHEEVPSVPPAPSDAEHP
jgi:CDP-diacylglycerol--serine O-phosphatidyltransferase